MGHSQSSGLLDTSHSKLIQILEFRNSWISKSPSKICNRAIQHCKSDRFSDYYGSLKSIFMLRTFTRDSDWRKKKSTKAVLFPRTWKRLIILFFSVFFRAKSVSPDWVTKPTTIGSKSCSSGTIKPPLEGTTVNNRNLVFPVGSCMLGNIHSFHFLVTSYFYVATKNLLWLLLCSNWFSFLFQEKRSFGV